MDNFMIYVLCYLFFLHFLADFVLQPDWVAKGKSINIFCLTYHVLVHSIVFFLGLLPFNQENALMFMLSNCIIHFIVDYFTSKINSKLYKSGNNHNFFIGIGADQYIHAVTIILTSQLLNM